MFWRITGKLYIAFNILTPDAFQRFFGNQPAPMQEMLNFTSVRGKRVRAATIGIQELTGELIIICRIFRFILKQVLYRGNTMLIGIRHFFQGIEKRHWWRSR